jgi:type II secretory ATPase GspE/PulE/Tfp pilus assembly ATPase PilB-like protein
MAVLLADATTKRADTVLLDFTRNEVAVRYQVDGLWHMMPPMDRATGDFMLAALKRLAGLDYKERQARQIGYFMVHYMRRDQRCQIVSQGVPTGERVVISIARKRAALETLDDLGMRPRMAKAVSDILHSQSGLLIVSALPQDGLSTLWRAVIHAGDRFMRDFYVVEEASKPEPEIVNFTPFVYDTAKGETPLTPLRSLLLKEPNVIGFNEIVDGRQLDRMTELVVDQQVMVVSRIHARSAADAIIRMVMMKPNVQRLMTALSGIVYGRLVRRLCTECRQAFKPNPALLAQLNLPPERVPVLYSHYTPRPEHLVDEKGQPIEPTPCRVCGGLGYAERIGVYELLIVTDAIREAVLSNPTVQSIAAVARQQGPTLRDEGLAVVAKGITSLEELQRVLKR